MATTSENSKAANGTEQREALRLELGNDGIAVITIDVPDQSQNTLNGDVINAASRILDELERDQSVRGVVFVSGKSGSFIAGADIHMIEACETAEEVTALSHTGQRIFNRIADFRVPVVAAIDGVCLGGGLELALACHSRVCTDDPGTRLGLPEVQLGLLPGSGGTQRLPRRIGIAAALDMMLTGRQVASRKALKLGLVDEVVPASILLDVARQRAGGAATNNAGRAGGSWLGNAINWAMDGNPIGRKVVFDQSRKRVMAKTKGNYPAPERIIECVEAGLGQGVDRGLALEAQRFGELAMTPQARQLIGLYFATTAMKKDNGVDDPTVEGMDIRRAAVLGGGLMGAGIGFVTADKAATPVRLKDIKAEGLANGLRYINERIDGRLKRRSLTPIQAEVERRRVTPTLDFSGFGRVDLVIEAVFEDLELKHAMVRDIESHCHERVIFASNTSSIPIARIAEAAKRPERVVGMHYFSPVEKMPLLEVIAHEKTAPEVIATAVAFGRRQGKTPIVVRDGAGFYVNRILAPYINEAVHLLREGVPIDRIDRALVKFGFPVGPFKLLDEVGIDISAHVAPILHEAFGERMRPLETAQRMIDDGRLGKKSGKGFYSYGGKRSGKEVDESVYRLLGVTPKNSMDADTIVERTTLMMLNEAVRCLDEGIIRGPRDGDIGAVFGIGFPPFLGGPFRYMDSQGGEWLRRQLERYTREAGERFAPAEGVLTRADAGRPFHGG
ncbi:MAG: fatty acid oxidation complex subunit alpha FadJ [Ectothiorhodospiraceae bacterium]|jgi:3-hydroxyacyl-CoA dehydrogenase/enoyl-CoA hydratase/3-hydroxybutyryl-CoA epimerase